jgi:ring-1,2-phenylacetyl-CoA epoxidase subunit PaaC
VKLETELLQPQASDMDTDLLLELADDELVLGWRDSEWTGIAPFLEEDVAFSSIAQNEVGHARAFYELAARELGTTADELAFDREPAEYRCAPLVELRFVPDWARTIARHVLYEAADEVRIAELKESEDPEVAGLAAKIDREEAYHRIHARMWAERLVGESRFETALDELWPSALAVLPEDLRPRLAQKLNRELPSNNLLLGHQRGEHTDELEPLWEEMTMVRRSVPGAAW